MRKTSLAALAALASLGGITLPSSALRAPRISRRKRYPHQSTRQELRGQRRAQGGPGITLNPRTFQYEPRA
jgi:hypothetical protein